MKEVRAEVVFLQQRMDDLDWSQDRDAIYRDFCGHVWPSVERLSALTAEPITEQCHQCHGTGDWRHGICRICGGKGRLVSEVVGKLTFGPDCAA